MYTLSLLRVVEKNVVGSHTHTTVTQWHSQKNTSTGWARFLQNKMTGVFFFFFSVSFAAFLKLGESERAKYTGLCWLVSLSWAQFAQPSSKAGMVEMGSASVPAVSFKNVLEVRVK